MGPYATLNITRHDQVAVLAFNRPQQLNALNGELRSELLRAIESINGDESIRVAILTGEGRAFCAGADLTDAPTDGDEVQHLLNTEYKPPLMAITEAPKPWISAVNGAAAGIGSAFAMNCDLTVMADDAYLYQAFTAIALIPDGGATWHLVRTVGRKRAYELIVDGTRLGAAACRELGLCNRVVPAEQLLPETLAWAQELSIKAPLSLRYAKQALRFAANEDVSEAISYEALLQKECIDSEDAREGVAAFLEKRQPSFKGR